VSAAIFSLGRLEGAVLDYADLLISELLSCATYTMTPQT
jgi:hypothetical protein